MVRSVNFSVIDQPDSLTVYFLSRSVGELNHPWTGLVRHSSNGWAFVDGSPVEYMPPRAFSNYPGENCSQINYYAPGIFDSPCAALSSSICQFPRPIPSICKYFLTYPVHPCLSPTNIHVCKYVDQKGLAAMLTVKKYAGVAP